MFLGVPLAAVKQAHALFQTTHTILAESKFHGITTQNSRFFTHVPPRLSTNDKHVELPDVAAFYTKDAFLLLVGDHNVGK